MVKTYYKIGEKFVNLNPVDILSNPDFCHSDIYNVYIEKGKNNIEYWVNKNKAMFSLVADNNYSSNYYALRQLIYNISGISSITTRLQKAGRDYYRNEAMNKIKTAVVLEYEALPGFVRNTYSIEDMASTFYSKVTKDLKNKINKAATEYFYREMREFIKTII